MTMTFALAALLTFVQPPPGAQVIGPSYVEVKTDAANVDRVEFTVDGVLAGVARQAPWRIAHDFGTSPTAHTIDAKLFANGYRDVRTATMTTVALTAGESVVVDLVEVPLRLHSSRQVTASDLRIRENGIEQTIRDVKPQRGAAHFVFVVDRSLSMGDGKLAAALHAIDENLNMLRRDDTASIVLFNHNVMKARAITPSERVADLFGDVTPSGGTSLRDAVASIRSTDRTYAIVITDGGDRNSELSEEEALRRISNTRTLIDAIILGDRSTFLDRAAKNTGGSVVRASARSMNEALHDALADINSRYLAVYQSHGTQRGWRTIDVTARTRGIAIVAARKGYFAE
ncbi:MAG TPA: VWA domain-containing protein [Thermoanaerobaculia bacterium]|nr:VWA domain-containing protein [Thermoanaerobaculia bacterium]